MTSRHKISRLVGVGTRVPAGTTMVETTLSKTYVHSSIVFFGFLWRSRGKHQHGTCERSHFARGVLPSLGGLHNLGCAGDGRAGKMPDVAAR
jgi:hypothetical protein